MFARTDTYTMSYGLAQQKRKLVRSWEMPGLSGRPCRRNWTHVSLGWVGRGSPRGPHNVTHPWTQYSRQSAPLLWPSSPAPSPTTGPTSLPHPTLFWGVFLKYLQVYSYLRTFARQFPHIIQIPIASWHHSALSSNAPFSERPSPISPPKVSSLPPPSHVPLTAWCASSQPLPNSLPSMWVHWRSTGPSQPPFIKRPVVPTGNMGTGGEGSYLEGGLHLGSGFRAYQAQSLRIQWVVGNARTCFCVFQWVERKYAWKRSWAKSKVIASTLSPGFAFATFQKPGVWQ